METKIVNDFLIDYIEDNYDYINDYANDFVNATSNGDENDDAMQVETWRKSKRGREWLISSPCFAILYSFCFLASWRFTKGFLRRILCLKATLLVLNNLFALALDLSNFHLNPILGIQGT